MKIPINQDITTQDIVIAILREKVSKLQQENVFLMNCIDELEGYFQEELERVKRGDRSSQQAVN